MNFADEQVVEEFLKTVPLEPLNTKTLFAISFIAPTGSGKTFVAKKISEKLNLYICSNDRIRRFLNNLGFHGNHPEQRLVEKISVATTKYLLKNKISHIIDVDLIRFHELAKKQIGSYGGRLYMIHIICPEELAIERIKGRQKNIESNTEDNLSRGTVEDYYERMELHKTLKYPDFFFEIDTSIDVDEQINNLILKFEEENIV